MPLGLFGHRLLEALHELVDIEMLKRQALQMLLRQPSMKLYINNPLSRYLMDWYFMRLAITFTPRRILWWEGGNMGQKPIILEATHVG